jgi:hypothetical protein
MALLLMLATLLALASCAVSCPLPEIKVGKTVLSSFPSAPPVPGSRIGESVAKVRIPATGGGESSPATPRARIRTASSHHRASRPRNPVQAMCQIIPIELCQIPLEITASDLGSSIR